MPRFTRQARLASRDDFNVVFENPRKVSCPNWQVLYRKSTLSYPRLGIIISKKFAKHAVARNRLRRVVRESFRAQQDQMPNVDVVLIAKRGLTSLDNVALRQQVDKIWPSLKA